jgi:hypothetical protein
MFESILNFLVEMDKDPDPYPAPDRQALDDDPDPAKLCRSERIRIHNKLFLNFNVAIEHESPIQSRLQYQYFLC